MVLKWRTSSKFCTNPPMLSSSLLTVGLIQMNPFLPMMRLIPNSRLWKWVLLCLISEGNTLTRTPCESWKRHVNACYLSCSDGVTFPYFKLLVCSDSAPSGNTFWTSALMRSPSWRYCRITCSSSADRRRWEKKSNKFVELNKNAIQFID